MHALSQSPALKLRWWRFLAVFTFSLLVCLGLSVVNLQPAQSAIEAATVVEILDGNQVYIQNKQARKNDIARKDQQVRTGESRTQLEFNTGAVGRLSKNAQLIVGSSCFQVQRGQILINGAVSGCTKSRRLSVRGTTYTISVDDQGQANIAVLEGEVAISQVEATSTTSPPAKPAPTATTDSEEIVLREGQRIAVRPDGVLGQIVKLSQAEFINLLRGDLFNGFRSQIPGLNKIQESFNRLFPGVPFPLQVNAPNPPANSPGTSRPATPPRPQPSF